MTDVPICHWTIGPDYFPGNEDYHPDAPRPRSHYCQSRPCLGSRCAMWIPRSRVTQGDHGDATVTEGFGFCTDNPNAAPWPDPAAKEKPDDRR